MSPVTKHPQGPAAASKPPRIALVGYGEVGQTLAADLHAAGFTDLVAWDRLFTDASSIPSRAANETRHVQAAVGMREALAGRDLVISAVTAGDCLAAAREASGFIATDAVYFDLNSVAPATKSAAGQAVAAAGARFVEAAVMSPIGPRRSASPMLLGGPHAHSFAPLARSLGFAGIEVFSETIGPASAAKMCRSVLVKGLEALLAESLLVARRHGVERTVLTSLQDLFPVADWPALARYMIARSLQHGRRRAEEMREVARTVDDAGVDPWMSEACVLRQDWAAAHGHAARHEQLETLLDELLGNLPAAVKETA